MVEAVVAGGRTRCAVLRADPPLTFRETSVGLHWVGSAAAPVGGDDLALAVHVGSGARLRLTSAAASLAHPGPTGAPSSTRVTSTVAARGHLALELRPTVLVRGCDHRSTVAVELAAGATLVWRDEVVFGRHKDEPGSLRQRLDVTQEGRPLLRTELAAGPCWPGSLGPAGTAGAKATGSLLLVGRRGDPPAIDASLARASVQRLAGDTVLVTALAPAAGALGEAFDAWLAEAVGGPGLYRRSTDEASMAARSAAVSTES